MRGFLHFYLQKKESECNELKKDQNIDNIEKIPLRFKVVNIRDFSKQKL